MGKYSNVSNVVVNGYIESKKQGKLQGVAESMPEGAELTADYLGMVLLYTGLTTPKYTQNTAYICNNGPGGLYWEAIQEPERVLEAGKAVITGPDGKIAASTITTADLQEIPIIKADVSNNKLAISNANDSISALGSRIDTTDAEVVTVKGSIENLKTSKVDKVDGKQLSTEDFTTEEKTKLTGIADNAQVNVIEQIKVNSVPVSVQDKAIDITVPTATSDITNDSNFVASTGAVFTGAVEIPDINLVSDAVSQKAMPAKQIFKYINETDDEIQAINQALEGKQPVGKYATLEQLGETNTTLSDVQNTANAANGKADANNLAIAEKADKSALATTDGKVAAVEGDVAQLKTDVQTAQSTADSVDSKVTALEPTLSVSGQTLTVGVNGKEATATLPKSGDTWKSFFKMETVNVSGHYPLEDRYGIHIEDNLVPKGVSKEYIIITYCRISNKNDPNHSPRAVYNGLCGLENYGSGVSELSLPGKHYFDLSTLTDSSYLARLEIGGLYKEP